MTVPEPDTPAPNVATGVFWRSWLRVLLPYLATATIAVALSLALQQTLLVPPPTQSPVTTPTTQTNPAPTLIPTSLPTPAPTSPPLAEPISRQELADLRAEVDRLWTVIYLNRAINQISDTETALRNNDQQTVDQSLIAVDDSLALAYERADVPGKDPIHEIRRQLGDVRDDVYLRPEGMDTRILRIRQTMLALVEARQS